MTATPKPRCSTRATEPIEPVGDVNDDRLRLIFTCCHPALAPSAQIALTLRLLGGLETPVHRPRVPRARGRRWRSASCGRSARSATPRSRTACPATPSFPSRLPPVLAVIYLDLQRGLHRDRGRRARSATTSAPRRSAWPGSSPSSCPTSPEALGLLALLLLTESRRAARTGARRQRSCCFPTRTARSGTAS